MQENPEQEEYEEIAKPRIWYFLQLISLIMMALVGGGAFGVLAMVLCEPLFGVDGTSIVTFSKDNATPNSIAAMRFIQVFSVFGTFVFSSIAQLTFMREPIVEGLGLKLKFPLRMAVLGILAILVLQPVISWLAEWSLSWHFPISMQETEQTLRRLHEEATQTQFAFLQHQTWGDFLANIFMIGLVAAFCEEVFFRRILPRLLYDTTGNVHVSIVISSLLFAVVHGQFFYLLPLFVTGLFLGYLAYWSKSLWLPVLIHFTHNGLAVCLAFFASPSDITPENLGGDLSYPIVSVLISAALGALVIGLLYKSRLRD